MDGKVTISEKLLNSLKKDKERLEYLLGAGRVIGSFPHDDTGLDELWDRQAIDEFIERRRNPKRKPKK